MTDQVRGFTITQCDVGSYHVTCWNADHTSCGVATYYDPGYSPHHDPMLLTENVAALEAQGRVNMTGKRWDYRERRWAA
jgi:hypothetical protein